VHQDAEFFLVLGLKVLREANKKPKCGRPTAERRFRSAFGCGPNVVAKAWHLLAHDHIPAGGDEPEHLLWALMFLKLYLNETTWAGMAGGVDEKTVRKWSWMFVDQLASLEPIVVSYYCYP